MAGKRKLLKNVGFRVFAVFIAGALGQIGAGAIMGVSPWISMAMAGILALVPVLIGLSWAFSTDGNLTLDEINQVFSTIQDNRKTGSEKKQLEAALAKVTGEANE